MRNSQINAISELTDITDSFRVQNWSLVRPWKRHLFINSEQKMHGKGCLYIWIGAPWIFFRKISTILITQHDDIQTRTRHLCVDPRGYMSPIRIGSNMAARRKPTETSVTEFCYKSMNLSLEELKNIKRIKQYIFEYINCWDSLIPRNKSLFLTM